MIQQLTVIFCDYCGQSHYHHPFNTSDYSAPDWYEDDGRHYCSTRCAVAAYGGATCTQCNKVTFTPFITEDNIFCSSDCADNHQAEEDRYYEYEDKRERIIEQVEEYGYYDPDY